MPTTPSHRKAKWLGAVALAALAAGGTAGSFAQTAAPAQTQAPITVQAPQMPSFADVVERVKPAVVSVRVKTRQVADRGGEDGGPGFSGPDLPDGHPLQRFFREFRGGEGQFRDGPRGQRPGPDRRFGRQSQGSGFIVSADGTVVTNNHVVDKSDSVEVVLEDGRTLDAKVIGTDPKTDLAVLKITEEGVFPFVKFAPVTPRVGDWVVAIGNPFGLGGTVTAGIVSARGRDIGSGPYDDYIQIDAAVNRGNSGGPTFNLKGEVVGVNTAIASPSGGNVGIAFAIPASVAEKVVADLKDDGKVSRGFIGVHIQPVTKEIADAMGLKDTRGALVAEATPESPAARAGIRTGDAIVAVDGERIRDARALSLKIASYAPGKSVPVTVWRDGKEQTVTVEVGGQEGDRRTRADAGALFGRADEGQARLGLQLAPAEGGEDGVAVAEVDPRSPAAEKGIRRGDVILDVGGRNVGRPEDVRSALEAARRDGRKIVLMRVKGREGVRFVAVPFATS